MDAHPLAGADFYEVLSEGLHVGSWCPTPTPTIPPTQVHLLLPTSLGKMLVRFKSAPVLDELIAALIKHRVDVWGLPKDHSVWKAP